MLDGYDLELRKSTEQIVVDERGQSIHDRPVAVQVHPLPGGLVIRARIGVLTPMHSFTLVVAAVGDVICDTHARLVEPGPDGIEIPVAGRTAVGRSGPQHHDSGAAFQDPLGLANRLVQVPERDRRRAEQPARIREPPGLEQPPVEGIEVGVQDIGAPAERLSEERQPGKDDRCLDTLAIEVGQPGLRLQVLRPGWLVETLVVGDPGLHRAQLLGERPGHMYLLVQVAVGERHNPITSHDQFGTGGVADRSQRLRTECGVDVVGERITRFVQVRVRIEQGVVDDRCHGFLLCRFPRPRTAAVARVCQTAAAPWYRLTSGLPSVTRGTSANGDATEPRSHRRWPTSRSAPGRARAG